MLTLFTKSTKFKFSKIPIYFIRQMHTWATCGAKSKSVKYYQSPMIAKNKFSKTSILSFLILEVPQLHGDCPTSIINVYNFKRTL